MNRQIELTGAQTIRSQNAKVSPGSQVVIRQAADTEQAEQAGRQGQRGQQRGWPLGGRRSRGRQPDTRLLHDGPQRCIPVHQHPANLLACPRHCPRPRYTLCTRGLIRQAERNLQVAEHLRFFGFYETKSPEIGQKIPLINTSQLN